MENFDVIIIGSGPGGYVAAIRAAQLGKKVALVEKADLGGVCLNWGCVPTKALLKSAETYANLKHADEMGVNIGELSVDIGKMVQRSRKIANQLSSGIKNLLKKNKVTVITGLAKLESPNLVSVSSEGKIQSIKANNIIIATGARPRIIEGFEPDGEYIWTAKEAMTPANLPKSLIVVGSGAIGIEFASFYNALGTEVTILEARERILTAEDEEIAMLAHKAFTQKGIKILTNVNLGKVIKKNGEVTLEIEIAGKGQILKAEKLLMAIGIKANTENLGLEQTKIKLDNNHIETNGFMQTAESDIYAIGDVTGAPWLAHKASHEGIIAAEAIAGLHTKPIIKNNIPGCTYSSPQIASVGLTEAAAIKAGYKIKVGRFPFFGNAKALVLSQSNGLIKTIFDSDTGEILGAHMIGADVTELIHSYVVAKGMEGTELDLIHSIFPHPTLSEMIHESALDAENRAVHI